jgi:ketosteroid isomerase-like protein
MPLRLLSCALVLLSMTACMTWPAGDQKADERAIRMALRDWVDAHNRGDEERASRIWAPGVTGWFPASDQFTTAAAAALLGVAATTASRSTYEVTIDEILLSGDLAVVRDTWQETRHFGDSHARRVIRSFEVWQRQSDHSWRITRWISAPEPWQREQTP